MARDDAWLRSLHARAADDVARFALRRAPTAQDAEDAVAEAFLVAWRRRDAVPEPPEDVLWLFGVVRNTLANTARGSRRRDRLRLRIAGEPVHRPEDPDPRVADLRAALTELGEVDAEILRLLAWEELSQREVGAVLGLTENAVALRASRARTRLAELMTARAAMGT